MAMEKSSGRSLLRQRIFRNWELYLMFLPVLVFFLVFHYAPMYGVQIAFKKFSAVRGIVGSPWRGLYYFQQFFDSYLFGELIGNTLGLSLYSLAVGFPTPILLALMMNELRSERVKRVVQTITYAPHFISMVVMCSMIILFLSPSSGVLNRIIEILGGQSVYFMGKPEYFKTIYVLSGVWQNTGWSSIIYMAALSGIDPQLHEAATIDGASRLQRVWHINLPGILPTAVILLIMNCGSLMSIGFEKAFLLMNDLNRAAAEIISTFVYQRGLIDRNYSSAAAIGLFNSAINLVLLLGVNAIARRISDTSLW
ncbi:MAG TPA: sugar ABC transporter permease [Candidatus Ornithocaccomicrobium faecavium]|uniref:Sugar ABC transporter permease n=1 Tax=Candidatus Ornithocaccomicrobium faecavium TaxID=2840890 RepID=A0A9D1P7N2_9FIRM|nr:sugar ABC transporter permease [Clostridiales bacterium]HIV27395.1 sugar ABC transporter permease [Candidatus Ornithocaccomicrobium faecavium]